MKCQLANIYSPTKNYGISNWFSTPKLDGIRGLYISGQGLISRTLKTKYVGLKHIENVCAQIAQAGYVIDGELYIPNEKFDVISGIVRDRKYDIAQKQRVQFHVFALWKDNSTWTNTEAMVSKIQEIIPGNQLAVVAVPYTVIESDPVIVQAQNQLNKDFGASLEGTMLRHPDVAYYQGRSQHLLKVKNFEKGEFIITDFHKGTGKYSNNLGKLSIEGVVGEVTVKSKVGTGFTDTERSEIWNNQSKYIGNKIEIIYMGVTNGTQRSLRHPVFSKFLK
ncbi:ATP-dependent DNA ligase [Anabaena azotica]|uniref:DNA ligase n=1 Tax=Anabaena azotica FACHB-119 TaxID=947527 RepID=A0ABR8D0K6_9NOST|nr:hypothetical protein [Anabaena azotica]MBD2499852.1 hypothetical protein [Anabaena azotica FACHB-119]